MTPVANVTEQAGRTLSLSPDTAHVTLTFVDQDLTNTGHTATVTGVSASGATSGILPGPLGTAELMAFFRVDNVVKASGLEHRHHQHHVRRARSRLRLSGRRRAAQYHLRGAGRRPCRRRQHAERHADRDRHQRRAGLSVRAGNRASDRGPEPFADRRSPRRWRSAVQRYRPVRYPHGLDHGDGGAFGRRLDSAFQRCVAGGIPYLAGSGFHWTAAWRGRLEFCARRTLRRASFPPARP